MQLRIKELREQRGMTLADLGKKVGRKAHTIFYYENGEINISLEMVGSIAKALGCSAHELFVEAQPEEPTHA